MYSPIEAKCNQADYAMHPLLARIAHIKPNIVYMKIALLFGRERSIAHTRPNILYMKIALLFGRERSIAHTRPNIVYMQIALLFPAGRERFFTAVLIASLEI